METLILFLTMLFSNPTTVFSEASSQSKLEDNSYNNSRVIIVNSTNIDKALSEIR